jgi:hypothetical protein
LNRCNCIKWSLWPAFGVLTAQAALAVETPATPTGVRNVTADAVRKLPRSGVPVFDNPRGGRVCRKDHQG